VIEGSCSPHHQPCLPCPSGRRTSLMNRLGYAHPIVRVPSELKTDSFWVNHLMFLNRRPLTIPQVNGAGNWISAEYHHSTHYNVIIRQSTPESGTGETISHTPPERYRCSVGSEELYHLRDILDRTVAVSLCSFWIERACKSGVNERIEWNSE
jgi:hypothetical protein